MPRYADAAWTDVRQAIRRILRSPGTSLAVILTLALAIAANTTILSLLKPTVLRTLAAPDPDALVSIGGLDARTNTYSSIHLDTLRALQSNAQAFARLGAFSSSIVRVETDGLAFDAGIEGVTPEYFDVLGVVAAQGRVLTGSDDLHGALAVITGRLSVRIFGDQSAIGRRFVIDGRQVEIIGVLPAAFTGVRMDGGDEVFVPIAFLRNTVLGSDPKGVMRAQALVGRLAPGATLTSARAEVLGKWPAIQASVAPALPAVQRTSIENQRLNVDSFARGFSTTRDRYGQSLGLVMGLALVLLAVGCVNLSGLMLARGLARQHEFAVRIALGVSRLRLAQQTLIDGLLLSVMALAAAIPLAWWSSAVLTSMVSVSKVVPIGKTTPDLPIILLAAAIAMAAGLIIGLLPARHAMASSMDDVLRGRGVSHRLRGTTRLVLVTQIAVSMILVVGAGLFGRTLTHLYANDVTPREREVVFTRLARNPLLRGTPLPQGYYQTLQQRLQESPGVDRAAFSVMFPGYLSVFATMPTDTVITRDGASAPVIPDFISPGLFEVYGIELLRGRDLTWADSAPSSLSTKRWRASVRIAGRGWQPCRDRVGPGEADAEVLVSSLMRLSPTSGSATSPRRRLMDASQLGEGPMGHVRVAGDVAWPSAATLTPSTRSSSISSGRSSP